MQQINTFCTQGWPQHLSRLLTRLAMGRTRRAWTCAPPSSTGLVNGHRWLMMVVVMVTTLVMLVTLRWKPVHQGWGRRHPREANEEEAKTLRGMLGLSEKRQLWRLCALQEWEESPDLQEPTLRSPDREKGRRFFPVQDFSWLRKGFMAKKERFPFFLSHFRWCRKHNFL